MLLVILGIICFIGLVLIHEWGHYVAARKSNVTVEEYGVGFPPRLYGKVLGKHKTLYSINALPLGGFVRLKGEHDQDKEEGSFGRASVLQKLFIIGAGVFMNLVTAFAILTILALVGIPHLLPDQHIEPSDTKVVHNELLIANVYDGTPAQAAGLQQFDTIVSIRPESCKEDACTARFTPYANDTNAENNTADTAAYLSTITKRYAGQKVVVTYERKNEPYAKETTVQLRTQAEVDAIIAANHKAEAEGRDNDLKAPGFSGISPYQYVTTRHTWSAPIVAANVMGQLTQQTFKGLGDIVTGLSKGDTNKATENVSGPVGIFFILKQGSAMGLSYIMMVIAVISLTLAIMNVLPIPALDGGRLFVILLFHGISKLRQKFGGKPLLLKQKTEDLIHGTGFVAMMLLFVLITFVDIQRFF